MSKYLLEDDYTERLRFRRLEKEDHALWLPFFKDPALAPYWLTGSADREALCRDFLKRMLARYAHDEGGLCAIILRDEAVFVGVAGLLVQHIAGTALLEVAYSLLPGHRGKGYATEAAAYCTEKAFTEGWATELVSIIHRDNHASMKVAERNGFQAAIAMEYKGSPVIIYKKHRTHAAP